MISQYHAVRALQKEAFRLKRKELMTPYLEGICKGLHLAAGIINELGTITKERMKGNPHYLSILFRRGH